MSSYPRIPAYNAFLKEEGYVFNPSALSSSKFSTEFERNLLILIILSVLPIFIGIKELGHEKDYKKKVRRNKEKNQRKP